MSKNKEATHVQARLINFSKELTSRDGEVLRSSPTLEDFQLCQTCTGKVKELKESGPVLTFKSVCIGALDAQQMDQQGNPKKVDAMAKAKRAKLARKIYDATMPIELSLDELSLVRDLVGESCMPLIIEQIWGAVDPKKLEGA